jgi:hypothetical protein
MSRERVVLSIGIATILAGGGQDSLRNVSSRKLRRFVRHTRPHRQSLSCSLIGRPAVPAQSGWSLVNGDKEWSVVAWEMEEEVSLARPVLIAVDGDCVLRRPDGKYEDNTGVLKDKPKWDANNNIILTIDRSSFK